MNIDGTEIFVEKLSGAGKLNFVLIHNAGSDHRFFTHQIEMLRKFGDVVQLDLPGSGRSHPISSYKMGDLSSIIAAICRKFSLKNICLIGLNNGANIAIDTVLHQSLQIEKLILIDPPIFMDKSFIAEINSYIESLDKSEFNHQFVASLVDALFLGTDSSHVQSFCERTRVCLGEFQAFEGEGCYGPMEFGQQPVAQLRDRGIL